MQNRHFTDRLPTRSVDGVKVTTIRTRSANGPQDWSFGFGAAHYVTGELRPAADHA